MKREGKGEEGGEGNITSNITTKSWLTLKDNEQQHRHHREQEIELQKI